jgi:hypothetical protein
MQDANPFEQRWLFNRYFHANALYTWMCAAGRVPPAKRSIKSGAAPIERFPMSFLFAIATACVILPILAGAALRVLAPAQARR